MGGMPGIGAGALDGAGVAAAAAVLASGVPGAIGVLEVPEGGRGLAAPLPPLPGPPGFTGPMGWPWPMTRLDPASCCARGRLAGVRGRRSRW